MESEAYSAEPMSLIRLIISLQELKISLGIFLTNNKHIVTVLPPMMKTVLSVSIRKIDSVERKLPSYHQSPILKEILPSEMEVAPPISGDHTTSTISQTAHLLQEHHTI